MGFFGFLGPFEAFFAFSGSVIVLLLVATTLYFIGKNIYVFFLAERLGHTVDFKSLGEWAVVTGATDGIGKGYALDLARRGCNIVLISRSEEKLRNVAKEIEAAHKVRTRTIAIDFGQDVSIYDTLKEELTRLEIGTLINNVGVSYPHPEFFHLVSEADLIKLVRVNCLAQTLMTRIVVPQMVARKKGVIVHLSSASGNFPLPFLTAYSASKAYNDFLGRALQQEYEENGIISQVVLPYTVATNMSGLKKSNLFVLNSEEYARSCLNTVGFLNRTNGHPSHAIQNWILMNIPAVVGTKMTHHFLLKVRNSIVASMKKKGTYKSE